MSYKQYALEVRSKLLEGGLQFPSSDLPTQLIACGYALIHTMGSNHRDFHVPEAIEEMKGELGEAKEEEEEETPKKQKRGRASSSSSVVDDEDMQQPTKKQKGRGNQRTSSSNKQEDDEEDDEAKRPVPQKKQTPQLPSVCLFFEHMYLLDITLVVVCYFYSSIYVCIYVSICIHVYL